LLISDASSQVLEIATLHQPVNLSGQWRFAPQDNSSFSQVTFDDSKWQLLHVPTPWGRQGHYSFSGVGWYRLNVHIKQMGQTAENEQIGITIGKIADSYELYVNGQLLGGTGSLPPNPKFDYDRERTYLIPPHLSNPGNQFVIASLQYFERLSAADYVSPIDVAIVYLGLGDTNEAIHWLKKAQEDSSSWMIFLKVDSRFDPIRCQPQFLSLLRRQD
jgi:hypothetical protein